MDKKTFKRTSRDGFTLLELVIAVAILSTVLFVAAKNFTDFSRAHTSLSKALHYKTRAQVVLDRVVAELLTGNLSTVVPGNPLLSESIQFQKIAGVSNGYPVYSDPIHIDLVPLETNSTDGLDNDGNGLIDEQSLRIWVDVPPYGAAPDTADSVSIIASNLGQGGLHITRQGSILLIELKVQEQLEPGIPPDTWTLRTGIMMRNSL